MIKPYYQEPNITIYHGDCLEIMPELEPVDLVLTDPPYGINHPTNYKERGRGNLASCKDYPPIFGDIENFNPKPFINQAAVLFGANYFCDKLPISSGWIVWDKERPDELDQATCEIAWSNFIRGIRRFKYLWNGMIRQGKEELFHPTQKPIALMKWILNLKWTPLGLILDPFMGSGTTLVAAKELGRKAIGIEIEEKYCEIAVRRLAQEVLPFKERVGD